MPRSSTSMVETLDRDATISTRGLTKVYGAGPSEVRALQGIDLDLARGEMVLLGAYGSGKSTLLNVIGGLDVPTAGQAYFIGGELTAYDEAELTRFRCDSVGFVFRFYKLIAASEVSRSFGTGTPG
jgi:putative ABC transport system ATP-binding protein